MTYHSCYYNRCLEFSKEFIDMIRHLSVTLDQLSNIYLSLALDYFECLRSFTDLEVHIVVLIVENVIKLRHVSLDIWKKELLQDCRTNIVTKVIIRPDNLWILQIDKSLNQCFISLVVICDLATQIDCYYYYSTQSLALMFNVQNVTLRLNIW